MISLNFRRQTVNRMCDALHERLRLSERPIAISAPPSSAPDGPSCAVLIDTSKIEIYEDDEIQADDDNQPLTGSLATLESKPNVDIGNGAYLSRVGKMMCRGRIWVGARLPPKREELEALVMRMFFDDQDVPGRWMIELPNPVVGPYTLPCPWSVTAFIGDSTWTGEYVFSERLWSWLTFELELDILVPRDNPETSRVKQFILGVDMHVDQPVDENGKITDIDDGADNEYYTGSPLRKTDINGN